jgi:rhamnosyltransferase
LAGSYSRQIPRPDAPFAIKRQLDRWHLTQMRQTTRHFNDPDTFAKMSLDAKRRLCAFDNVSAAIRRDVWEEVPFPAIPFGEDLAWSLSVIKKGYKIAYVPDSRIIHSHNRSFVYNLRRAYIDRKLLLDLFGDFLGPPSCARHWFPWLIAGFLRDAAREGELIPRNILHGCAFYLANFVGTWLATANSRVSRRGHSNSLWSSLDRNLTSGI